MSKTNPPDAPILTLALTSKTLPLSRVEDLADTRLAQRSRIILRRSASWKTRRACRTRRWLLRQTVTVTLNQYKAGIVNYLYVTVVQAAELANERTAADILGRRMIAAVLLIKALGGGWSDDAIEASAK
jgi:outer membrane protein TolC